MTAPLAATGIGSRSAMVSAVALVIVLVVMGMRVRVSVTGIVSRLVIARAATVIGIVSRSVIAIVSPLVIVLVVMGMRVRVSVTGIVSRLVIARAATATVTVSPLVIVLVVMGMRVRVSVIVTVSRLVIARAATATVIVSRLVIVLVVMGMRARAFGDRDRKPFGDRPRRDGDARPSFGDRDRKPFGDRPRRDGDARPSFGDRDRKPFGDRDRRPFGDRPRRDGDGERRSFGDRPERGPRKFDGPRTEGRSFGGGSWEERPARVPNAADLRSANRPDRERSPEIDDDVTGQELDRVTKHQIKTLEGMNADWVAKHLVMAGRLIDIDPELSFQHALAASRRGGRLAAVREAVGLTAYAAGHYGEALREFRTYRRISGSNVHLPLMADCERGLGRPDRALDVVRSPEAQDLDAPGKVELAIVASGARSDLGQLDAAVAELEIIQLDINRAFSYSPRLFRAYADALTAVGRTEEAGKWQRQAVVAENALGVGDFEDPDIIDLGEDDENEARKPRFRNLEEDHRASRGAPVRGGAGTRGDSHRL